MYIEKECTRIHRQNVVCALEVKKNVPGSPFARKIWDSQVILLMEATFEMIFLDSICQYNLDGTGG